MKTEVYMILWAVYPPGYTARDPAGLRTCAAVDTADWIRAQRNGVSCRTVLSACVALHRPCRDPYFRSPPANTATWSRPYSPPKSTNQRRCRRVDDHEFRAGMQLTGHNHPTTFPDLTPQLAAT